MGKMMNNGKLMNIREVSVYLRIPLKTVYRLARQGKIKGVKVGKHWRFLKEDIDYYLQYGRNKSSISALPEPTERRAFPRINTNFKCCYAVNLPPFKNLKSEGFVKDLSGGGVLLVGRDEGIKEVCLNDPIELRFLLVDNGSSVVVRASGKVVRKIPGGMGVKFKQIDENVQSRIMEYAS